MEEIETSDYKTDKRGKKYKAHKIVFNQGEDDNKKGVTENMKKSYKSFLEQHTPDLTEEQKNELVAELLEVLGKDAKAGDWISDFVHSDNPKFKGKSKEKRKQMALAAFYAKQRNEEVELEEAKKANTASTRQELSKRPRKELTGSDADKKKKESDDAWERLMAHAANKKANEEVELEEEFDHAALDKKYGAPRDAKEHEKQGLASKSHTVVGGKVYHWQDPRAKAALRKEELEIEEVVVEGSDYQSYLDKHSNSKSSKPLMNKTEFNTLQRKKEDDKKYKRVNGVIVGRKLAKEEVEVLDEASVASVAKAHGFEKVKNGFEKGSYKHPKTGETITPLRGGQEYGHSRKDGSTVSSFNHKSSLEGHLAKHGYKKTTNESVEQVEEGWDDMLKAAKKSHEAGKTSTATKHDIKKTSTGTVYTKQRDADGNSKEFNRSGEAAQKRGRGRPKKNSFSEAAEFLMSLTEEQFDDVTSEGFDIFFKSFENINK